MADSGSVREIWRMDTEYVRPLLTPEPPLSREEWIERIERIRYEEAGTICRECGSTTPELVEKKMCGKCGETWPLSAFHRNRRNLDGLDGWCKPCRRPYNARAAAARRKAAALKATS